MAKARRWSREVRRLICSPNSPAASKRVWSRLPWRRRSSRRSATINCTFSRIPTCASKSRIGSRQSSRRWINDRLSSDLNVQSLLRHNQPGRDLWRNAPLRVGCCALRACPISVEYLRHGLDIGSDPRTLHLAVDQERNKYDDSESATAGKDKV